MKKLLAVTVCLLCLVAFFSACRPWQTIGGNTASIPTRIPYSPSSSAAFTPSSADPSGSPLPATPDTDSSAPVTPTPTVYIRPAQSDSIVPSALLTVGYTTPLKDAPKGYRMPYYIEVDISNQCVNIFVKNKATGKYDVLLNRFICSGGTSTNPTLTGEFYIKTQEQQRAATGQNLKYKRYYFQKYESYAYYVTRYKNEYMFHSFTFAQVNGKVVPKSGAYYNMGNPGSAGCLRMLMNHAKWIYDNVDGGTYCVVTKNRPVDSTLRATLKKYLPPLGWDMLADYEPGNNSHGLVRTELVSNPDVVPTPKPTPVEESPTPDNSEEPSVSPDVTPTATPTEVPSDEASPTGTTTSPTDTPTASSDTQEP